MLSYFQNGSLIHVDSRPAPRLSIELQQSNIYTYTYIYDRPRDTYPSSYSSLTVGMIGPDTPCLELQQSYHTLSTYLNNKFQIITHISQSHFTTQYLAYCCATILVQPTRQHVLQLSSKTLSMHLFKNNAMLINVVASNYQSKIPNIYQNIQNII